MPEKFCPRSSPYSSVGASRNCEVGKAEVGTSRNPLGGNVV